MRDSGYFEGIQETSSPLFIHQLVEQLVAEQPDRIAVIHGADSITYRQLNERSNALCQAIQQHETEADLIGISTSRSLEMIVGVLAILKAGKAYLPLDFTYPENRLRQIVADSRIRLCLCSTSEISFVESLSLKCLDLKSDYPSSGKISEAPAHLAYVLYTSGSTGTPKGVCMGHSPLVNLLQWQNKNSIANSNTRTLQFAPLSFDVSFQEIFATLTTGGTLVLIDDDLRLDPNNLLAFIQKQSVHRIFLPFVALQFLVEAAVISNYFPACLQEIMTAGEQLKITPQLVTFFSALPDCVLYNQYGPTECHVVSQLKLDGDPKNWPGLPAIGKPIDNTQLYIVDQNLTLLPEGESGELCLAGACLADGYLYQPALTEEKFVSWNHPERGKIRMYRTGDLARYLPDGTIDYLGRLDDQVKIRGYRIELGEIEVVINRLAGIKQAVVVANEDIVGQKRLIAYLVASGETKDISAVRRELEKSLPNYMMPSAFVWLDHLPKTTSGKVDKKSLPKPEAKRPELATLYKKPASELEKAIAGIWTDLLQVDRVGTGDNFFESGGNSLLAQKTVVVLKNQFNHTLPITKLYQYPTVAGIADFLQPKGPSAKPVAQKIRPQTSSDDVAIIGMAGRFPGANTIEALWEILKQGQETTRFFTEDELDPSIPDRIKNDPSYVRARGIIDQADQFDAAFFGLNPKLAELMDPQQRIFLEIAWEALEQTGHLPPNYAGTIGVYAGCGNNTYYSHNVLGQERLIDQVGSFQVMTVNEKDYIASRTAYQLNLKGPAVSVYSACSTSLLAIAQAVESIRNGQCDVALAGGASITSPINSGHIYQEGAMLSRDGHCRSFDADAQGTVFSDGAGVVLLKNLDAARRDGDTIYAVIKGVGINNDGGGKGSFTAPNAEGQAGAIAMALADARIEPATISYVEAHGTATPLGDPIEIEGLTMAFGDQPKTQFCAIGSIKSNLGHLTQAAGVAGLIKTTLALYHRQIPASLGFSTPNPAIDFKNSPFFVNTKLNEWHSVGARRAGVSSFGVGGTNVHVVLEEFENEAPVSTAGRPLQLITWSAKTAGSREAYAHRLAEQLRWENGPNLADVAFTLQTTRPDFNHRRFVVAATNAELVENLIPASASSPDSKTLSETPGEVVFMFPGQGAQYLNMGAGLYESEPVYRAAIEACAELVNPHLDLDIRQIIYPKTPTPEAEDRLKNTRYTQPALFITEYALAKLWMSWGIEPSVFCGHSIGEFVAAHLAGVFTLNDALRLTAIRGRMVSELPRGSMLSVRAEAEAVGAILPPALSIAAINSPKLCVVSGRDEDIAAFGRVLDGKGIPNRRLMTSHAFHSAMMDPVVGEFQELVAQVALNRPQKPVVSTVSGTWLTDVQATDPQYWARHLRLTVRFADALETVFGQNKPLLLEVGPGNVTSTLARQQAGTRPVNVVTSLENTPGVLEYKSVLKALGQLWLNGLEPNWQSFYANQNRIRLNLPTYAFDKKRCWVDPVNAAAVPVPPTTPITFAEAPSMPKLMRKDSLLIKVKEILEDASGIEMEGVTPNMSFLEIGLDSLLLTQVALTLKKEFGLPITFRQLNEEYATLDRLVVYLDSKGSSDRQREVLRSESSQLANRSPDHQREVLQSESSPLNQMATPPGNDSALGLIAQQLQILAKQVALLQGSNPIPTSVAPIATKPTPQKPADLTPEEELEIKKPFGATARIDRQISELTEKQQDFLKSLTQRYTHKTAGSKAYSQKHRAYMADPRVVSGFKPLTKEVVYPIVVNKSKGSRLWDVDGNEYIDVLNGFGSSMFGYQPDIIKNVLHEQIEDGFEVGPQHELAGEVSKLICEFTGFDRAALCSTGSEAVLGVMRIARTVTGRSLIVAFTGSYHGIVDEVLVRGTKKLKSYPAAPGIMPEAVQNMLILDYGTDESLRIIQERAHELAAVLVEPVQSRRPEYQPIEFLKQVRKITADSGTALIFDEVITGFRMHPGGAQALFGVKADLASYGKVVGGGLPIGAIAGKKTFMDALDGGFWQYGDASYPEVGVTYFAGTFVRHPLALAAAKASLQYMKDQGPALQAGLNAKTERLASTLNVEFERMKLPFFVAQFGSLWKIKFKEEIPYSELLFTLMREKGVHVCDGFPCFLTEAHTNEEIDLICKLFGESVGEMIEAGFFKTTLSTTTNGVNGAQGAAQPPTPGAKLGRDKAGNPAWFIANPDQPGKYLQVEIT
ncbi:MAG: amino acid adenylation domain-containing protein [Cytophagaceae bacterium]|nr:amino acid adenylation domain-containing protein [Cytophagaceae bacterium]